MVRYLSIYLLFIVNALPFQCLTAQMEGPIQDALYRKNIKTIQFFKYGWEFSYPILVMNESSHLILSFDDLDNKEKSYNYTIIHCNANWEQSSLTFEEYADGFSQNKINDYHLSNGTMVPYIHYTLEIPNEQISLKVSGNYILEVFEENDSDHPVMTKRFVVSENKVSIEGKAGCPILPAYQSNKQQVEFSVIRNDMLFEDPTQTIKIAVIKNNQWNFCITDLPPYYVKERELDYNYDDKLLFSGGNEYRSLDDKSLKNTTGTFESFQVVNNMYDLYLDLISKN